MPRPTTMNLSEAVAISASSLWAHKLRSVLTLIGVVIGVAAVIAVVSLINGANQYVATRVFRLGADVFGLSKQPSIITNVDDWLEFQKRKRITYDDFQAVREQCKSCKEIGASLGGRVEVKSGLNSLKDTNLRAWTPQMPELYDVDLVAGRHITDSDLNSAAPVCVIGMDIVENLMPGVDPVGKEVRWNNIPCEVIGIGKKKVPPWELRWTTGSSCRSAPTTRNTAISRLPCASPRVPARRQTFSSPSMKSDRSCAADTTCPTTPRMISQSRPAIPFSRCGRASADLSLS